MRSKTDEQIHHDVLKELRWDTRVEETEVGVEVDEGVVTLTGTVSSYAKKLAALEAAHRVSGVLDVADDIKVQIPGSFTRTDTEIAQAVREALEWNVLVPDQQIRSTVANGWVTLTGAVTYLSEREDAEKAIRDLRGVSGVTNKLVVNPVKVAPNDIRFVIEDALERRADREADRIDVKVNDGTVTLAGSINSWEEKRAIVGAVSHAPGVVAVRDNLRISLF
jgi:osmotically-inducible protein OsmY